MDEAVEFVDEDGGNLFRKFVVLKQSDESQEHRIDFLRKYLVLLKISPRASTKYGRSPRRNLAFKTMFSRDRLEL
jgi:hypothetical protein